jgi:hypothetical protein
MSTGSNVDGMYLTGMNESGMKVENPGMNNQGFGLNL